MKLDYFYLRSPDRSTSVARLPSDDIGEVNSLINSGWRHYNPKRSKREELLSMLKCIEEQIRNLDC